jgi:hypothetical protein
MCTAVVDLLTPPLYPVTVTIFIIWLSGYLVFKNTESFELWRPLRYLQSSACYTKLIWLSGYLALQISGYLVVELLESSF